MTAASASSGGIETEIATTSGRGIITSAASLSAKSKTFSIIPRSSCSISPCSVERVRSMRSSASDIASTSAPGGSSPSILSTNSVERWSTQTSGAKTVKKVRTGAASASAVPSE